MNTYFLTHFEHTKISNEKWLLRSPRPEENTILNISHISKISLKINHFQLHSEKIATAYSQKTRFEWNTNKGEQNVNKRGAGEPLKLMGPKVGFP